MQSKVLGGFHIVSIHDEHGKLIFKEKKSQKAKAFRPWFIANCNEAKENVEIIAAMFEKEILACTLTDMDLDYNEKKYSIHLRFFPMVDSKLIDLGTGLGGGYCSCCTASEDEALVISNILKGTYIQE